MLEEAPQVLVLLTEITIHALSQATNEFCVHGNSEFVIPGERLDSKVIRQLKLAVQPSIEDIQVKWGSWAPKIDQAPKVN